MKLPQCSRDPTALQRRLPQRSDTPRSSLQLTCTGAARRLNATPTATPSMPSRSAAPVAVLGATGESEPPGRTCARPAVGSSAEAVGIRASHSNCGLAALGTIVGATLPHAVDTPTAAIEGAGAGFDDTAALTAPLAPPTALAEAAAPAAVPGGGDAGLAEPGASAASPSSIVSRPTSISAGSR